MFAIQMISVVQTEAATLVFKLVWRQALERGLRCDRHEDGQWDWAMRKVKRRSTCSGDLCLSDADVTISISLSATHTEHFPSSSNVSADGIDTGAMVRLHLSSCQHLHDNATANLGAKISCGPFTWRSSSKVLRMC